jgi:hypothetical protein
MPVTESSVDFDWFSPEVCRDPQLYDGLIREAAPVVYSEQYDVWATGRHAQIELMMRDWKTFSSTKPPFEEIGQPMILLSDDPTVTTNMAVHGHETLPLHIVPA